jgi:hypothetical protein
MAEGFLGGLSDFAGGVGDFFTGGGVYGDPKNINQRYGVPEADVRQAGLGALGNVGALLLAAGQSPDRGQRAQFLGQLGGAVSGMNTDIYKSSQARLMNAQQQGAMRELEENRALSAWAQSPENLKSVGLTPEQFRVVGVPGLKSLVQGRAAAEVKITPEMRERQALEMQKLRQQVEEGNYIKVGNELYRKTPDGPVLVSPQQQWASQQRGVAPVVGGGQPSSVAPVDPSAASISPSLDYGRAFGVSGVGNRLAGATQGLLGTTTKSTAEATKAISEVQNLKSSVMSTLSSEVAGRNLKSTQERVGQLFPNPAELLTGTQDATNKMSSIRSLLDSEIAGLESVVNSRGTYSAADKAKADQAILDLRRNRNNIDLIVRSLTAGGPAQPQQPAAANRTSGGIEWRLK